MIESIKKALLAGVGAAAITREKAEKALNELVEKGKLSAGEAKDAAQKIADEGKREFEEASKSLESRFNDVMAKLGRGQKERIETLETKVEALERRLAEMEAAPSTDVAE